MTKIWRCGDTRMVCESDKMNTTAFYRSSPVQRGCYMETRGGNTTFGVEIGALGLLFGELCNKV